MFYPGLSHLKQSSSDLGAAQKLKKLNTSKIASKFYCFQSLTFTRFVKFYIVILTLFIHETMISTEAKWNGRKTFASQLTQLAAGLLLKVLKCFKVMHRKKYRVLIGLMNHPIRFIDRENKTKLVSASFSELLWKKVTNFLKKDYLQAWVYIF